MSYETMYNEKEKENKVLRKSLYHCIEVMKEFLRTPGEDLEPYIRGALKLAEESYNNVCTCHRPEESVGTSGGVHGCTKCRGWIYEGQLEGLREMRMRRFEGKLQSLVSDILHQVSYK